MTGDNIELSFFVIVVVFTLASTAYTAYRKKHRKITLSSSSVLLTYYTDGKQLFSAKRGTVDGMHYSAVITTNIDMLLYRIELPFATKSHIVSIPKAPDVPQLDPSGGDSIMERVSLEGDFPNHFSIFAEKDQQSVARYIQANSRQDDGCWIHAHGDEIGVRYLIYTILSKPNFKPIA